MSGATTATLPAAIELLAEQVRAAVELAAPEAGLRFRAMFGGAGAYAHDRMFASLSDVGLAIKLGSADREALLALLGAAMLRFGPELPASKESVVVPPAVRASADELAVWVRRSIDYAISLPEKPAKKRGAVRRS